MAYGKIHEKHGLSGTAEFAAWVDMFRRCYEPKCNSFRWYGAKGIKVDERWRRFLMFWKDMGLRPSARHSIDRINSADDYTPENCRWATIGEQNRNLSSNINITHDGMTMCASQWAEATGLSLPTILARYHQGLPAEQVLASARAWNALTYEGLTLPHATWARRKGIPLTTFVRRVKRGWPVEMVMADAETAAHYQMQQYYAGQAKKAVRSAERQKERAEPHLRAPKNASFEALIGSAAKLPD